MHLWDPQVLVQVTHPILMMVEVSTASSLQGQSDYTRNRSRDASVVVQLTTLFMTALTKAAKGGQPRRGDRPLQRRRHR